MYNNIDSLVAEILLRQQLMENANSTDSLNLLNEMSVLQDSLASRNGELSNIKISLKQAQQNQVNQLISQNDTITAIALPDSTEQAVNTIWLNMIATGSLALNAADSTLLTGIASLCPLDGGNAVYRARSILRMGLHLDINDDDLCNSSANQNEEKFTESIASNPLIRLFPNPAKKEFMIDINETNDNQIDLFLYDGFGKRTLYKTVNSGRNKIPAAHLPEGIYLVTLKKNGTTVFTEKLMIIR